MDTVVILAVLLAIIVVGVIWVRRSKAGPPSMPSQDQDTAWNDTVHEPPPHVHHDHHHHPTEPRDP